ncbi:DUF3618 domain-containing protein [Aquibium microcysteis]|uniref:DUF3618 domain-containing protein n=1 Tax=Aquibium microcysteis TaxID=675281 RepID=UPI00165D2F46|nr:DUF3618 domain-containing protein [Aquibium microcysteis]
MTTSTEHERHAEEVRARMAGTAEQIRDRMSPGQLVDEVFHYMRDSNGSAAVNNLGRQVRDNPLSLALIGAGVAWLFAGPRPVRREYYPYPDDGFGYDGDSTFYPEPGIDDDVIGNSPLRGAGAQTGAGGLGYLETHDDGKDPESSWSERAGSAAHRVSDAGSSVAGAASRLGSNAAGAARQAGSRAGAYASEAGHYAADAGRQAARAGRRVGRSAERAANQARDGLMDALDREPLIVGALGLALGAAIGAMLPKTRIEDETFGQTRDDLKDEAMRAMRRGYEGAKDVAAEGYAAARKSADEEGLTSSDGTPLAEKVGHVASAAGKAVGEKAREMTGETGKPASSGPGTTGASASGTPSSPASGTGPFGTSDKPAGVSPAPGSGKTV